VQKTPMNIKYILVLFIISIQFTNAQVAKNNKLYASSELSIGNYLGVDVNLNMVTKKITYLKLVLLEIFVAQDQHQVIM